MTMSTPFTVEIEKLDGDINAFNLRGELDHATAPELRAPLDEAIEEGARSFLIDLSDCSFIDSTGLSVIVHARSRVLDEDRNGRFEICCPDVQIRRLLEITGIDRAFGVHQTREEALSAIAASSG
jgi:anti-sigma B factor antagonist